MSVHTEKLERLEKLAVTAENRYATAIAKAKSIGTTVAARHKCFICYHGADIDEVTTFVETYGDVFIPRVIGVSDSDHFDDPVNSEDQEYIKSQIAAKYLWDSSVTIVYVGKCTWSRKYVDWEISATLRNDTKNKRSGLLAITPPDKSHNKLPSRIADNYANDKPLESYARYIYYPTSASSLRTSIQDAYDARDSRAGLVRNSRDLRRANTTC